MGLVQSVRQAFQGVAHVIRRERNARIHLVVAIMVMIVAAYLKLSAFQTASLVLAVIIVFLAEITNTAIEKMLDLVHPATDERVRIIKDMAAGGVLVASFGAAAIAILVLLPIIQKL